MFPFSGIAATLGTFAICTVVVWFASVRMTRFAEIIADRSKAGKAFIGTLLLGLAVSLPELAVSASAALRGHADLAINTLLGGIALTMAALAITDAIVGSEPLSSDLRRPVVLVEGLLAIVMLMTAATGMVVRDRPLLRAGVWTYTLFGLFLLILWLVKRGQWRAKWSVTDEKRQPRPRVHSKPSSPNAQRPIWVIAGLTFAAGIAILVAGSILELTVHQLAAETGVGANFIGFVLGGLATTIPEVASTIAAAKAGEYEMAYSDAFGTNLVSVALLFLADLLYRGGPLLNQTGPFAILACLLGALLTSIYLIGLVVRSTRTFLRMGLDSLLVLLLCAGALLLLFQLSP
jgi:cation:H+ antiporter